MKTVYYADVKGNIISVWNEKQLKCVCWYVSCEQCRHNVWIFPFQPELKALVRTGVPHEHRATIWNFCIDECVQETRRIAGDEYYHHLLESIKGRPSPAVKQIELDLLRTLPNNKHYDKLDADGVGIQGQQRYYLSSHIDRLA